MSENISTEKFNHPAPRQQKVIRRISFSPLRLFADLAELIQYRDLIVTLSVHRLRVRYKQSLLGVSWALLQPLSLMVIYTLIFSRVAKMPSDNLPYTVFAFAGLLPWIYFQSVLVNATNSLVSHSNLITKVYFPREILPLTYVIAALFDFLIASTILIAMMLYYRVPLTPNVFYAFPVIVVLTLFACSMAFLLSASQVWFRDIGVAVPLLLQIWLFATPVVYPLSAISVLPRKVQSIYILNPMVGIIEDFRRVVVRGMPPDFYLFNVSALVAIAMLPVAYIYFKRAVATAADVI
jgi:lipopolysaccharide transport system permease protein